MNDHVELLAGVLFELEARGHGDPWAQQTNVIRDVYRARAAQLAGALAAAGGAIVDAAALQRIREYVSVAGIYKDVRPIREALREL